VGPGTYNQLQKKSFGHGVDKVHMPAKTALSNTIFPKNLEEKHKTVGIHIWSPSTLLISRYTAWTGLSEWEPLLSLVLPPQKLQIRLFGASHNTWTGA
jgi:hypothetical protein